MTEDEAKQRWCPMVVFMLGGGQVRNRDACYDMEGTHCIGSACMMWRWTAAQFGTPGAPESVQDDFADGYASGYCGLAGKP